MRDERNGEKAKGESLLPDPRGEDLLQYPPVYYMDH